MRRFRICAPLVTLLLLAPSHGLPALAQDGASETVSLDSPAVSPAPKGVDELITELKRERDPEAANRITEDLMETWNDSDSATVDLLMQWALTAASEKRNAAALDFLDQAIVLKPDFVGAWNQRATLHYTMGNYKKAVSDINRVLALEPRHFGALAGLAAILSERGSEEMALKAWERYLEIYPADRQAQEIVIKLSEQLAGSRT
ncbi:tetratricopeptide repeat protein [Rhizobium sp. KAs_5_22]|uniref:tetratricopeptide repeat protein n=1 Tax=Ciceribacter selenitireducens TaxID=448181 RepID=UPI00048F0311|nr:tetratricopeptide repeat protein [Ciceribacter selenitireducens]PPJ45636.1 tetratricopeptide repeat protein [Rhizobium sp. KAs_5_22]